MLGVRAGCVRPLVMTGASRDVPCSSPGMIICHHSGAFRGTASVEGTGLLSVRLLLRSSSTGGDEKDEGHFVRLLSPPYWLCA